MINNVLMEAILLSRVREGREKYEDGPAPAQVAAVTRENRVSDVVAGEGSVLLDTDSGMLIYETGRRQSLPGGLPWCKM